MRIPAAALLLALAGAPAVLVAAEARVTTPSAHVGSWGLEVTIGRDCSGPDQLDLGAGSSPVAGLHEACLEITAAAVEIAAAGAVLRAGRTIALGNDFTVAAGADLNLELAPAMADDFASILDPSPIDESVYHASFALDASALALGAGDEIEHFTAFSVAGEPVFRLTLRPAAGGGAELHLAARQDGGGWIASAPGQEIPLPSGWTQVELSWAAGDGGGELLVSIGGGAATGLTGLDNDAFTVDSVRWGAISGSVAASSGLLRLDAFDSWR